MSTINYRFRVRRGLASAWTANNPTLLQGEFGLETDTGRFKIGDGSTAWNSLNYYCSVPLADPGADKLLFWDDSASIWKHLTLGSGLSITDTTLNVAVAGAGATLEEEMLADSPTALWKCDETAGTTLADATGNGHDLTLSGTYSLAYSPMIESLPTTSFLRLSGTSANASRAGSLGLSVPFSGDWTITAVVTLAGTSANGIRIFNITGSGETEAANTQASLTLAADYEIQAFWEHSAGSNDLTLSGVNLAEGRTFLLALRKNGTANTVDFLINGKLITSGSYANEPTGGSSVTTYIGSDAGVSTGPFTVGYVGFFPSAISNTRLAAYAIAAGLFGH